MVSKNMRHLKKQVEFKEKYLYESCKLIGNLKNRSKDCQRETSWANLFNL